MAAQQVRREAALVASMTSPPVAPTAAIVAMAAPNTTTKVPQGPQAVEVHQNMVMAPFLELVLSTFMEDGKPEMAEGHRVDFPFCELYQGRKSKNDRVSIAEQH